MALNWKIDEVKDRSSQLLDRIVALTKSDNVITKDEEEMVTVIKQEIFKLESKFTAIIEKQLTLDAATIEIKSIFEEVITQATRKAKEDGTITSDELILIDRLAKFFRNEDISQYLQ